MSFKPTRVILHCAATPDYPDDSKKYDLFGAADIKVWHVKERGFSDIGYHYVVRRTGEIESGRPLDRKGAHTLHHNHDSIGVCWVGTRWPTLKQVKALIKLHRQINRSLNIPIGRWFGHNEFTKTKTCPGFSMHLFREFLSYGLKQEKRAMEKPIS